MPLSIENTVLAKHLLVGLFSTSRIFSGKFPQIYVLQISVDIFWMHKAFEEDDKGDFMSCELPNLLGVKARGPREWTRWSATWRDGTWGQIDSPRVAEQILSPIQLNQSLSTVHAATQITSHGMNESFSFLFLLYFAEFLFSYWGRAF